MAWVCWWRVMLTWQSGQYSPTGAPEQVLDVIRAAQLRRVVLAARAIRVSATTGTGCVGSGVTRIRRGSAYAGTS